VVGITTRPTGNSGAFRWTAASGMTFLPNAHVGVGTSAHAASHDGSVIVGAQSLIGEIRPVAWTPSGMQTLGHLPGMNATEPLAITPDGEFIVGGSGNGTTQRAFRWSAGRAMEDLGSLPGHAIASAEAVSADGRTVVGNSGGSGFRTSFRWTESGGMQALPQLPGGTISFAKDVSADGSVVVGFGTSSVGDRAFIWTESTGTVAMGTLPGATGSLAWAVTPDGETVVGRSGEAFIWRADTGMLRLSELLGSALPSGWTLNAATSISADGRVIAGVGSHNGRDEAWVAVIPAPSAAPVLLLGLAAQRRRRR
jgi:uncharacterized protein (TIGR03382 family)